MQLEEFDPIIYRRGVGRIGMVKRGKLPWALEKRSLLYERTDTDFKYWGDFFFENERYADALEFYITGEVEDGIAKMKEFAVKEGDYYTLAKIADKFEEKVSGDDWLEAAEAAMRRGKFAEATWLYERAGERGAMRNSAEKAGIELPEEEESGEGDS